MLPAIPIGSLAVLAVVLSSSVLQTQTRFEYQVPPQAIVDLVDTRPTPNIEVSPSDKAGNHRLFDRTDFGTAAGSRAGAAGIPVGRLAVQSEDKRTEQGTLHHVFEAESSSQW